jgi:hypothetical protein
VIGDGRTVKQFGVVLRLNIWSELKGSPPRTKVHSPYPVGNCQSLF